MSNHRFFIALFVKGLALLLGTQSSALSAPYLYSIMDLGTLGGGTSRAYAINNAGQVAGSALNASGLTHATLFSGAGSGNTDLGTFGGNFSEAYGINNAGQVVGYAITLGNQHAVLFSGTGSGNTGLGTLGGSSSVATAINTSGRIVGAANTPGHPAFQATHATQFLGAGNVSLDTLGGFSSRAAAVNNAGQVVGWAHIPGNERRATLFSNIGIHHTNLGTLGGNSSEALAINHYGQVVGQARTSDGLDHATLFSGTGSGNTDLGTLGGSFSAAYGINMGGQVVGYARTQANDNDAFLWRANTGMVNLEDLFDPLLFTGWELTEARGINDSGQIVGFGTHNGQQRAFLMTLLPEDDGGNGGSVPEPGSLALVALAMLGLRDRHTRRVRNHTEVSP